MIEMNEAPAVEKLGTRAVLLKVEAGAEWPNCDGCDERIKFLGPVAAKAVIYTAGVVVCCNVYEGDRWDRREQYHLECYEAAAQPHGPIYAKAPKIVSPEG